MVINSSCARSSGQSVTSCSVVKCLFMYQYELVNIQYVCMNVCKLSTFSRVALWINQIRLPILLVVS